MPAYHLSVAAMVAALLLLGVPVLADDAHHPPQSLSQAAPPAASPPGQAMPGVQRTMGDQGMMGQSGMMGGQGMMGSQGMMPGGMIGMMRMMMGQSGMMPGMPMSGMTDHVEGRIAFLRTELKITDAQARPWNEFANALRENAKRISSVHTSAQGQQTSPTVAQALELQERLLRARVDGLATTRIVYDHLQAVLSDEQKKLAEQLLPPHLGLMPGMMM